jgi:hypothetical protein
MESLATSHDEVKQDSRAEVARSIANARLGGGLDAETKITSGIERKERCFS